MRRVVAMCALAAVLRRASAQLSTEAREVS